MGWLILIDILLIIVLALMLSVTVTVHMNDDTRIKVKYAGITVFSISPEDEKQKKEGKQGGLMAKLGLSGDIGETIEFAKQLVSSACRPIKRLINHIRVNSFMLYVCAGGDDAAKAAHVMLLEDRAVSGRARPGLRGPGSARRARPPRA